MNMNENPQHHAGAIPRKIIRGILKIGLLEWIVGIHLVVFIFRLINASDQAGAKPYLWKMIVVLALLALSTLTYRGFFEGKTWCRSLHQAIIVTCVFIPFFMLQKMIPIINPVEMDAKLSAIDHALVGLDASVWLERFATTFTSAWFAVSYFGYYIIGGSFILGMMFFCKRQDLLVEFGFILLGAACIADIAYTIVPARGPYHYLASVFAGPLPGETIVPFVHQFIKNGPLRDVFPSMHTCIPLSMFLFSVKYFRTVAIITGLWIPHIILSTMFLRYHYLIDVLAGIFLAFALFAIARPSLDAYQKLRLRMGVVASP